MSILKIIENITGIINKKTRTHKEKREDAQESRANEIDKLKKEQEELSAKNQGGIYNTRLADIARKLGELSTKSKNAR
jgi:hypothetical protein